MRTAARYIALALLPVTAVLGLLNGLESLRTPGTARQETRAPIAPPNPDS